MIVRSDVGVVRELVDAIGCLVDESKLHVTEAGVSTRAVDAANVAMTDVDAHASQFERLEVDGERTLGLNIDKLGEILSMSQSKDEPVVISNEDETQKLNISMPESGFDFSTGLISPDAIRQEPDLPELDLPGGFVFSDRTLSRGLQAAGLVADRLSFSCIDGDELMISASGDMDDVELTVDDDLIDGEFASSHEARSVISLDYIRDIESPIPTDAEIRLLLGDEFPVKIIWAGEHVTVESMIAPRIES